ncbi:MAG: DUF2911 domain-containing protein [Gemmatimonadaceae bacterium]
MKRLALVVIACAGCAANQPSERYGFIAQLGNDTLSVESVTRTASTLVSDEVDRFPRVRQRHTTIELAPDGSIKHLEMDITTPGEPENQRQRHVVADVTHDSVKISKRDGTGTKTMAFATHGVPSMAHLPQMYSLYELYFAAGLRRADSMKTDTVRLHQFYIDREFDRFPLHDGVVRRMPNGKAEIRHDWLAGVGEATMDSARHMLKYDGARTTYKVNVVRITELPDVAAIGMRFATQETSAGGMKQLSVRDTARATIGSATFFVDYSRPLARGRVLLGNVIPFDYVWRTGANAATQFSTSAPITIGGLKVPAGMYTLWTVPHATSADLIINKQVGQWGTGYDESFDLGKAALKTETVTAPMEEFRITITPVDATHGTLVLEWGTFRWSAPISLSP